MIEESTVPEASEDDVQFPGQLLALAREQRGLTEEDVAERLNLSTHQIRALEAGRFSDLPGKTYVLGYIKAYARLVELEEAEVLKNFNLHEDVTIRGVRPVIKAERSGGKLRKLLTVPAVFALAVLGFLWWQSSERNAVVGPGLVQQEIGSIDQVPAQIEFTTDTRSSEPSETADPEASSISDEEKAERPEDELRARIEAEEQLRIQGLGTETPGDGDTEPAATDEAPQPLPAGGGREVSLNFDAASWVDLRDADDKRLVYEHVSQGRRITVEGTPPFSVFLGNAEGVRIEYEGKPFDFSEFANGVYARFTLGDDE